ncbi:MAG: hypothetical protein GC201_08730 [Alphaproteobacteria bacterium]|nr:hypothetical protein [Alphaproteobacteria bacterium]
MAVALIIVSIVIGLYVVMPVLAKSDENAQRTLERISAYRWMIGLAVLVFAVVAFLVVLLRTPGYYIHIFLSLIALLGAALVLAVIGYLMAYDVISQQLQGSSADTQARAAEFRAKWEPRLNRLGIAALALGFAALILRLTA